MPEINHKELSTHIREAKTDGYAPVYLIFGDELLSREAFRSLLDVMIPEASRSLNFEAFEGMEADMSVILERLNTFSLISGIKVLALSDAPLFDTNKDLSDLLVRSKKAADANETRKAARYLLSTLALQGLALDDLKAGARKDLLKMDAAGVPDGEWLDRVMAFCLENDLSLPESRDQAVRLQESIEKGFPGDHHLIITTERIDKRKKLYSAIDSIGIIVDCSVPKGDRRADRQAQDAVLRQRLEETLHKQGKTLSPGVFEALREKSGFDLRTFTANLEKLVDYTGDRPTISLEDVEAVLTRTKKDPIYEFTNAVTDRDMEGALFFMNSLLDSGERSHPLQLLTAVANQVRKLLLVREFIDGPPGRVWHPGIPFQKFRKEVMPVIQEHDASLGKILNDWEHTLTLEQETNTGAKKPKKSSRRKRGIKADIFIAPNPKNAYPIYLMMKKAGHFTPEELLEGLSGILDADLAIKSGAHHPRRALERVVINLTRNENQL